MSKPKRRAGRPPLPVSERKDRTLQVRLRAEEYDRIQKAADAQGVKPSEWVRRKLLGER